MLDTLPSAGKVPYLLNAGNQQAYGGESYEDPAPQYAKHPLTFRQVIRCHSHKSDRRDGTDFGDGLRPCPGLLLLKAAAAQGVPGFLAG